MFTLALAACVPQLYPYECKERLVDVFTTGDDVTVDLSTDTLTNNTTGERNIQYSTVLCTLREEPCQYPALVTFFRWLLFLILCRLACACFVISCFPF